MPNPNMGIKEQLHLEKTSHSLVGSGAKRSPFAAVLSFMQPNEERFLAGRGGGLTRATGLPFLVTRIFSPEAASFSRRPRQVALNFEMAIVFMRHFTMVNDYGQTCANTTLRRPRNPMAT